MAEGAQPQVLGVDLQMPQITYFSERLWTRICAS